MIWVDEIPSFNFNSFKTKGLSKLFQTYLLIGVFLFKALLPTFVRLFLIYVEKATTTRTF